MLYKFTFRLCALFALIDLLLIYYLEGEYFLSKLSDQKSSPRLLKSIRPSYRLSSSLFLQKRSAMFLEGACIYVQGIMGNLMRSLGGPEVWKILQK